MAARLRALLAPAVRRLARGSVAAATTGLAVLGALAVAAVTVAGPLALGGLLAVFHVANAAAWPLWKRLLHGRVAAGQRATTLSASSLALMAGALGGSLLVPRLVEAAGIPAGFWAAAGALLLVALVSLRLRPRHSGPRTPDTPAAAGVAAGHG